MRIYAYITAIFVSETSKTQCVFIDLFLKLEDASLLHYSEKYEKVHLTPSLDRKCLIEDENLTFVIK